MCGRKLRACFDPFPCVGKTGVLGKDFSQLWEKGGKSCKVPKNTVQYDILHWICYMYISAYNLHRMLHESKCLVVKLRVLALATEASWKPCQTPLGSYHYNQASFEETGIGSKLGSRSRRNIRILVLIITHFICVHLPITVKIIDDRCANPRILFRSFHAPHPSKNTKNWRYTKNVIKIYKIPLNI